MEGGIGATNAEDPDCRQKRREKAPGPEPRGLNRALGHGAQVAAERGGGMGGWAMGPSGRKDPALECSAPGCSALHRSARVRGPAQHPLRRGPSDTPLRGPGGNRSVPGRPRLRGAARRLPPTPAQPQPQPPVTFLEAASLPIQPGRRGHAGQRLQRGGQGQAQRGKEGGGRGAAREGRGAHHSESRSQSCSSAKSKLSMVSAPPSRRRAPELHPGRAEPSRAEASRAAGGQRREPALSALAAGSCRPPPRSLLPPCELRV